VNDKVCLCPGCSLEIRTALVHSCEALDPLHEQNPDWTTAEIVALARTQAAELLKMIQRQKAQSQEQG
jgi:hypothetical protein